MHQQAVIHRADRPVLATDALTIFGMGFHEQHPAGRVYRPTGLNGYLFTFFNTPVLTGSQEFQRSLPANSLIIWSPGQRHAYGQMDTAWEHSWLHCTGSAVFESLERHGVVLNTPIHIIDPTGVDRFFATLKDELHRYPLSDMIIRQLLELWLQQLARDQHGASTAQAIPQVWQELKRYLEQHFAEEVSLASLAQHASLQPQYLCRMFKHYFGLPPIEYLQQVRLQHAQFLLRDHNLSITTVARQVGYSQISYFSRIFSRQFGVSPLQMRKGLSGEEARREAVAERKAHQKALWLREGWEPLVEFPEEDAPPDIGPWTVTSYDEEGLEMNIERPAPHLVTLQATGIRLHPVAEPTWCQLRWEPDCSEEVKIELTLANTSPFGPNLAIAISGDLLQGYRLRIFGYEHIEFETVRRGTWEVLFPCPVTLDPTAKEYRITLWRADNIFYAEIDGQRIMTYSEPLAAQGSGHRHFALGRKSVMGGETVIRQLRVFTRRAPQYVDILEPGRILLRGGHVDDANHWFTRILSQNYPARLQQEAQFLLAFATPATETARKEAILLEVARDEASPFRIQALRDVIHLRLEDDAVEDAITLVRELLALVPDSGMVNRMKRYLYEKLPRVPLDARAGLLSLLATLPITTLDLPAPVRDLEPLRPLRLTRFECRGEIASLAPLAGMPLNSLVCTYTSVHDLAPLRGMPLEVCRIVGNRIADLSPLAASPLRILECTENAINSLEPLRGLRLTEFYGPRNQVAELSPLRGMPLTRLACAGNPIRNVAPLAGMPLTNLDISDTEVADVSPLAASPLRALNCSRCPVEDLSPLRELPLQSLRSEQSHIRDLEPLAATPLQHLFLAGNPIEDFAPLAGLPLSTLSLSALPRRARDQAVIAQLPLTELVVDALTPDTWAFIKAHPTLQAINGHQRSYVEALAESLTAALRAWIAGPETPARGKTHLRAFATRIGSREYLTLPIAFPFDEALRFCSWQGGIPASLPTSDDNELVMAYIRAYTCSEFKVYHHLGLELDARRRTCRWLSDAAYHWGNWLFPLEYAMSLSGTPCFNSSDEISGMRGWTISDDLRVRKYLVIEWAA